MKFKEFGLAEPILEAILEGGYESPTPIQEQAIPIILKKRDLLGCAQTGTGKTAAFALPIIHHLISDKEEAKLRKVRALILTPTRELALQIRDNFRIFGKHTNLKCNVIFGGVNQKVQVEDIRRGVDIIVATPGRLLDLINQGYVKLDTLKFLVLDEADTMLDMGFINDIKKIVSRVPKVRQTLLFSATMPDSIETLAETFLSNHETVKVNPVSSTVHKIEQSLYYVDKINKAPLLIHLMEQEEIKSALIFTRTKHGANKLGELLEKANISCGVIHGNKSQNARVQALNHFKRGKTQVLIATDIAARGIDIDELSHVFNYEMPDQAETYVHRIGRTGRAGKEGRAISFSNIDEKPMVKEIERLTKKEIPVIGEHDFPMENFTLTPKKTQQNSRSRSSKPKRENGNRSSFQQGPKSGRSNNQSWNNSKRTSFRPKGNRGR